MDLNNEFNNQIKSKKFSVFIEEFGHKCRSTTGGVIVKKSASVKKTLGRFRGPCRGPRHSLHTACEKTTYKDACVRERVIWRWHNGRNYQVMAFTGIKFCKPTVVDPRKQSSGPVYQPLRLLSSSVGNTMHPPKSLDFPFVPLTVHKVVEDNCIPTNFDIMNDDTNFDGDFSTFDNGRPFTNARSIFKNASLKGCHQFPMVSISQLVGGFVGSKSQVHAKNRESHQIWDIVFKKLDEFVSSRPVERYSEHCYEFQTLSQNLIGTLYKESNSALGLAASYILADRGQSFKNSKPNCNIAKSSPTPVEITSSPVDTFVSTNPTLPSHSPSNHQSSVPVIFNFVEHLISQSDHDIVLPDPLELTRLGCLGSNSNLKPSTDSNNLVKQPLNNVPLQDGASLGTSDLKQSYAEVAKMAHAKSKMETDHRQTRLKSSSKHNKNMKVNNHYFARNFNDSRQRCVDSSNWRDQASVSGRKDLRRDHFTPAHSGGRSFGEHRWKSEHKCESVPTTDSQGHRMKKREGLRYLKPCSALKTVHEVAQSSNVKEAVPPSESTACYSSPAFRVNSCQFYNSAKRSCMNWRCRQNCQKSSAKRNMKYILMDNVVRDCSGDQSSLSDASPSPNENRDIRINNSFELYVTMPPSGQRVPNKSNNLSDLTRGRSDSEPCVQSLPCTAPFDKGSTDVPPTDDDNVLTRPRSLSETIVCRVEADPASKERSLSESSESVKSVPRSRSNSEDSKTNSLSSSSLSSSNSCKVMSDGNLRLRFSSECDSEDSFVIFDGGMDCEDYDSTDIDSDDSSESSEDEVDSTSCSRLSMVFCRPMQDYEDFENAQAAKMRELNARWGVEQSSPGKNKSTPCKKVQFVDGPCLTTVHPMVKWDFAYRAARCGPWEEMARDRERFKQRVERSEPVLALVLRPAHREKVRRRLESSAGGD